MKRIYHPRQLLACICVLACILITGASATNTITPDERDPTSIKVTSSQPPTDNTQPDFYEDNNSNDVVRSDSYESDNGDAAALPQYATPAPLGQVFSQLMFGQEVEARNGAVYYESADQAGSGRQGTSNNIYTEQLYIAGFAQVDSSGNLVNWLCYDREDVPVGSLAPSFTASCRLYGELYIATYTNGFTTGHVGWYSAGDLDWKLGSLEYPAPEKDPLADPELTRLAEDNSTVDTRLLEVTKGNIIYYKPIDENEPPYNPINENILPSTKDKDELAHDRVNEDTLLPYSDTCVILNNIPFIRDVISIANSYALDEYPLSNTEATE